MANPRKFSEKIALHNHRQAEETAAFEKIMKEVIEVTTKDETPHTNRVPAYRIDGRSRARSQGGPIRRPHDRKLDTSPYSSGTYLSPPTDTGWRRTNSDSALHQSTMQGMVDRGDGSRGWNMQLMNGPDRNLDGRPRSSCDVPTSRVPGISIHPSAHDPTMIQIPIANTGSLPDLTNVDFSSPIHAPLDQDHDSSPYSSSPVNTSPSTLSPTSIPQGVQPQGRFHFTPVSHAHSNHLSVPLSPRYQQQRVRENVSIDKNVVNLVDGNDFSPLHNLGMYQQQCPPTSPSPTLQQAAGYRSPRPSPQSSPSPGGRHSAPCSPGAPSPLPNDYQMFNQHQASFQQHFEQLSMMDTPNTVSYVDQTSGEQMTQSHPPSTLADGSSMGNIELISDPGYYSTSPSQPVVYQSTSPGLHTTPNTPNSLPEITLTDFSVGDMPRQDSLTTQLESELLADESFREGLGSLDFEEFRLLSNPALNIPEIVEDNLRFDRS